MHWVRKFFAQSGKNCKITFLFIFYFSSFFGDVECIFDNLAKNVPKISKKNIFLQTTFPQMFLWTPRIESRIPIFVCYCNYRANNAPSRTLGFLYFSWNFDPFHFIALSNPPLTEDIAAPNIWTKPSEFIWDPIKMQFEVAFGILFEKRKKGSHEVSNSFINAFCFNLEHSIKRDDCPAFGHFFCIL